MGQLVQTDCRNRLLALLCERDFALLMPNLEPLKLDKALVLAEPDQAFEHVVFPESGVVSIVTISTKGRKVEAGLFGQDGFGPYLAAMGSDRVPNEIIVQVPGHGHRIRRVDLAEAVEESPSLKDLLQRYVYVQIAQIAHTALSNATHAIPERLARWILMCHDRTEGDDIPLTHEYIAVMLAVRRPSVTTSLHELEGQALIRTDRGHVSVRNREALEAFAIDAYGKPEAEYMRLIGPMRGKEALTSSG